VIRTFQLPVKSALKARIGPSFNVSIMMYRGWDKLDGDSTEKGRNEAVCGSAFRHFDSIAFLRAVALAPRRRPFCCEVFASASRIVSSSLQRRLSVARCRVAVVSASPL